MGPTYDRFDVEDPSAYWASRCPGCFCPVALPDSRCGDCVDRVRNGLPLHDATCPLEPYAHNRDINAFGRCAECQQSKKVPE